MHCTEIMTKLERTCLLLLVLSFGLQYLDSSWADLIQLIALPALSLWYGLFGVYALRIRPPGPRSLITSAGIGVLLLMAPIGALFRLQQWPQNTHYLALALILSLIAVLIILTLRLSEEASPHRARFRPLLLRSLGWFLFCLSLFAYS